MIEDRGSRAPDGATGTIGARRQSGLSGVSRPGIPSGPRRPKAPGGPNTRWPPYVQYVFVAALTLMLLMLAVSMQRHHFLNGEFYGRTHPTDQ